MSYDFCKLQNSEPQNLNLNFSELLDLDSKLYVDIFRSTSRNVGKRRKQGRPLHIRKISRGGQNEDVYLLPPSLTSTRHVGDIVYLKKKGRIVRFLLTTLVLWKSRGKGRDVFFIESEKFDP